jgi:hypothetical protein
MQYIKVYILFSLKNGILVNFQSLSAAGTKYEILETCDGVISLNRGTFSLEKYVVLDVLIYDVSLTFPSVKFFLGKFHIFKVYFCHPFERFSHM